MMSTKVQDTGYFGIFIFFKRKVQTADEAYILPLCLTAVPQSFPLHPST